MSREFSGRRLSTEEREALKRFGDEEIRLLRETFKGLANGKDGISVEKETFLKCFPMRGLLGERLFEVIDKDGSGSIHYNEFVYGLAILFRGSRKEKLKFVFDLYDLSEAGSISRHELMTMLHQFPESALELIKPKTEHDETNNSPEIPTPGKIMEEIEALVDLAFPAPSPPSTRLSFEQFCHWCENTPGVTNFLMSVLPVEDQALRDNLHSNSPAPVAPADGSGLPPGSPCPGEQGLRKKCNSFANLHMNRPVVKANAAEASNRKDLEKTRNLLQEAKQSCSIESVTSKIQVALVEVERLLLLPTGTSGATTSVARCGSFTSSGGSPTPSQALDEIPGAIVLDDSNTVSGELWKRGLRLRKMTKRHYVLQGNFLYYYAYVHANTNLRRKLTDILYSSPEDTAPRGVTFLSDCYVEVQPVQNEIVEKAVHYYGIDIVPEAGSSREKRTVFTRSIEAQKRWAAALRQATDKIAIEEAYGVGAQLGRGRFSKVCEATHKHTGVKSAVKIIDKSKLQPTEKELLRTEIAILKLVRHPNIIRLYDVYEDRQYIFIVTELVSGGELFNRIVGRARYTEAEARVVMRPLLESVNYLHRLGIVHRDLKPENILCGDSLTDLKIADFGLSKLVHPEELMKMPCGTLNYVAPEVLALVGYGREADIWSLGVIMYLLLRGELPFYGKAKSEVIQKTLHAEINLETDAAWRSVSPAGKSLLRGLLTKDPAQRLTAQNALLHEWFSIKTPMTSVNSATASGPAPKDKTKS
ncbi:putative myosin light chain kinase [Phytophthora citrophthora]|uniref:non-specific serine/threonine protein kinase n=1 Tax=Phytophthora citrophthora TaxID=4793 RepID=A0AAD9GG52_9STRA|nr:putative myosin light chain kinase [Phytophthora citrophthora]